MALAAVLRRLIEDEGALDLARWWALCQSHPRHGYYATRDPLGAAGDFVTAPEISQLFGELVGLALAQAWLDRGARNPVNLVEIGPGRGTLMADALRAGARVPGFLEAADLHLVETSPSLRRVQEQRLAGPWHDRLEDVPAGRPTFLVANELLDALPIRQLERRDGAWRERRVGIDAEGRLGPVLARRAVALPVAADAVADDGAVIELAPAREAMVAEIAHRLRRDGGVGFLIDYGHERDPPLGDTLQAVRGHRRVDPFADPGEADLTSHVAFTPLVAAARAEGAVAWGPVPQGTWLRRLGIEVRLERLARANPAHAEALASGVRRLIDPGAMGELFKVLALSGDTIPPPGFDEPPT